MRAFFATNRDYIGPRKGYFGHLFQKKPDFFRVGWADYDEMGLLQNPDPTPVENKVYVSPERYEFDEEIQRYRFTKAGSTETFREILKELKQPIDPNKRKGGLVFIPGFDYSFLESIGRAAHLAKLYSTPTLLLVPIVFSWPSDGSLTKYVSDRRDAELSGYAIARAYAMFLELLRKLRLVHRCDASLHLLAHSMGAYALRHAVVTLSRPDFPPWPSPIFDSVIIPAGDEDRDTLEHMDKLGALGRIGNRIDVYVNENDKPVRIGDDLDGEFDRIGAYGPLDPTIVTRFNKPLSVVDCQHVDMWGIDGTRHQYYRVSPTAIADIKEVISGIPPERSIVRKDRYVPTLYRYVLQPV